MRRHHEDVNTLRTAIEGQNHKNKPSVEFTSLVKKRREEKSFLLNFPIANFQKYQPYTFIFDLGGSFESLTRLFKGSYLRVGLESQDFKINPFSLEPTKRNLDFLALFMRMVSY